MASVVCELLAECIGDKQDERGCLTVVVEPTETAWQGAASAALTELGAAVLQPAPGAPALITSSTLERCQSDARPRLDRLHNLAFQYDAHADTSTERCIQFQELASRHPKEDRFDVTVMYNKGASLLDPSGSEPGTAAWRTLVVEVDQLVQPIFRQLAVGQTFHAEAAGFVMSHPGAPSQQWHPDDLDTSGLYNVFIPLIDVTETNGPTELALSTHGDPATAYRALGHISSAKLGHISTPPELGPAGGLQLVRPQLRAGSLLIFVT